MLEMSCGSGWSCVFRLKSVTVMEWSAILSLSSLSLWLSTHSLSSSQRPRTGLIAQKVGLILLPSKSVQIW